MPGPGHKDDLNGEPPGADQATTPYGSPASREVTPGRAQSHPPGAILGERYELLDELGRGGMGVVYRARDRETGDTVALKLLQPEIASDADVIARFKAELSLARKITHKNICRSYDLHRLGDTTFITMEYVEGQSLRELLKRTGRLPVGDGLRILHQVIAGLGEAHAQRIVHRDLKPENIVIARDGTVKVMDFGIARSLEAKTSKTGTIIGTPAYMSPEQAEGKVPDARSDIYALGLVMYEMFTGQLAFKAETPVALAIKQILEHPTPPRDLEPTLPADIEAVISKCLEKDPTNRFQTVAELEAALAEGAPRPRRAGRKLPPPGTAAASAPRPRRGLPAKAPARVFHPAVTALLGGLLVAVLVIAWRVWRPQPSVSVPTTPTAPSEPARPAPRKEVPDSGRLTPPGPPAPSPGPVVYHSTGKLTQGWWNGAGGTACCGCGIQHYGVLPGSFAAGYVKATTFFLTGSRSDSYYTRVRQGPTVLKLMLGDREATAQSREALPGETAPLDVPWLIRFEFDTPVYAQPGTPWKLLDGDNNIYSAVLLHQSNVVGSENKRFALEGTSDQNGCQYTVKKTAWYSAKFEYQ